MPNEKKKDIATDEKKKRAISVPDIDGDDYDTVKAFGVPLTTFVRQCFKKRADELRAIENIGES